MTTEEKRAYGRAYYYKTKEKYAAKMKKYRLEIREYVKKIKEENPCTDCGKFYPHYVMDFDHLKDKSFVIGKSGYTLNIVKKEIAKCELVCSNCHRERTHARLVQQIEQ